MHVSFSCHIKIIINSYHTYILVFLIFIFQRLAIVNIQNRQRSNSPRRFTHLGGFVNRAAADRGSIERSRLYAAVQNIQPDSEKRLQAIRVIYISLI
ncbi:unnamed protein product [Schistosoma margrebowiei]|uniref:Uncharacterized protein n=1 Tax=Schistosoma margrebowiei TaxID=48269 RepID=A0A183NAJ2_9TREM|nr:unnamed protein product [Schistosoma margrebowiei]